MDITQREEKGVVVFSLNGRIDNDGATKMEQTLQSASEAGKSKMVLDLSTVQYINSAGLRVLAEFLTINREKGGELYLSAVNSRVKRVFQIVGFDNFFKMFDSTVDAANAF